MEIILVGGYAVSAYGPPRFSVDLDIVLESVTVPEVRDVLRDSGFTKARDWDGGDLFIGRAERWTMGKGPLPSSVDLLIGGVSDRVSKVTFAYSMLRERAKRMTVRGLAVSSVAEPLVPSREALIAMKLHVARRIDMRDIAVLSGEPVDREEITSMLTGSPRRLVLSHIRALLSDIETRQFKDSLKGVYMIDDSVYSRCIDGAKGLGLWLKSRFQDDARAE